MTQKEKLVNFLSRGSTTSINSNQARSRFKIQNLRALVHELRSQGYAIYSKRNQKTGLNEYRMGRPTRTMVALAYEVRGGELFTN